MLDLSRSAHFVRGVGGDSSESVRVEMVDLPWLEMAGGVRFDQVSRVLMASCTPVTWGRTEVVQISVPNL